MRLKLLLSHEGEGERGNEEEDVAERKGEGKWRRGCVKGGKEGKGKDEENGAPFSDQSPAVLAGTPWLAEAEPFPVVLSTLLSTPTSRSHSEFPVKLPAPQCRADGFFPLCFTSFVHKAVCLSFCLPEGGRVSLLHSFPSILTHARLSQMFAE